MSPELTQQLKQLLLSWGADLVGVAPAHSLSQVPGGGPSLGYRPTDLLPGATSVITFGKRTLNSALARGHGSPVAYLMEFLNMKLNEIGYELAKFLEDKGYKALPVFFNLMVLEPGVMVGESPPRFFSYRHAAVAAGLGEIGLSRLLLTPQYGPRLRWLSLVTDAPLMANEPFAGRLCDGEKCGFICVQACPAQALSQDGRFDWQKCHSYTFRLQPILGYAHCALCMKVCPVGLPP